MSWSTPQLSESEPPPGHRSPNTRWTVIAARASLRAVQNASDQRNLFYLISFKSHTSLAHFWFLVPPVVRLWGHPLTKKWSQTSIVYPLSAVWNSTVPRRVYRTAAWRSSPIGRPHWLRHRLLLLPPKQAHWARVMSAQKTQKEREREKERQTDNQTTSGHISF